MTIRELQYAIQQAIDEEGLPDTAFVDTIPGCPHDVYAVVPGRDENGLNRQLDRWFNLRTMEWLGTSKEG